MDTEVSQAGADHRGMVWIVLGVLAVLYVLLARRASARLRAHAAANEHAALHDPVTELPNRVLFHERVHRAIRDGNASVLMIDLDRFKEINDTLGHHNGDLLLCMIGARLVPEAECVARLGGDEFAVLVSGDAEAAAVRIRAAISERLELEGIGVEVEASVGIASYPAHGDDPETLLQRADAAMYAAKRARTGCAVYRDGFGYSRENLELIADLRRALDEDELVVYYQPKAALATGRVVAVEALVRWQHPERGLILPDAFIPLAENTGLMRPLTLQVLDRALAQCRAWDLGVSVNVSTRNLLDPTLPEAVDALLEHHGVPADRLELEITETTIMADPARAKAVLDRLRAMGVDLAVDDFGTGYTSLRWLRELPVTTLKIDKSFVMDFDSVIVSSIVQLGRSLGLQVVAEGVEDAASWEQLRALGCDLVQGYYLSRPQPEAVLTPWLAASTSETGGLSPELSA